MSGTQIILTQKDYSKLQEIKNIHQGDEYKKLEEEMEHAKIVQESDVPTNIVTMNSQITLLIINENKQINLTIVYPCDADCLTDKISILSPLGLTLLGLKVNEAIDWSFPDGQIKTLKVLEVRQLPITQIVKH